MDTYFVSQWNKNAWRILNWFKTTPKCDYNNYEKIVKKLFELVINDDDLPTQSQLNDYMTLCLHLVQRIKRLSGDEVSCE
jgi:hypothetical protein